MDKESVMRLYSDKNIERFYNVRDRGILNELNTIMEYVAPKLPYHNIDHMRDVSDICQKHAIMEGLDYKQVIRLAKAGKLHNVFYVPGREDNKEIAVEVSRSVLMCLGESQEEIGRISRLIMATKYPTNPGVTDEMIICDADIDNVGRDDFFVHSEMLRIEEGIDNNTWYGEIVPRFLEGVRFNTFFANTIRGPGLRKNKEKLKNWSDAMRMISE